MMTLAVCVDPFIYFLLILHFFQPLYFSFFPFLVSILPPLQLFRILYTLLQPTDTGDVDQLYIAYLRTMELTL